MGSHPEDAPAGMNAPSRVSGLIVGLLGLAAVAAVAVWVPGQDPALPSEATVDSPSVRPGDPGAWPGWGEARFSHYQHFEELAIACVDCHHETNAGRLITPHETYFEGLRVDCALCHERGGEERLAPLACVECHPKVADGAHDQLMSTKVVVHETCWTCHEQETGADAADGCLFCHDAPATARGGTN